MEPQQPPQPPNQPSAPVPPPPLNTSNKGLEYILPINRSGWAIAAGYVALFSILLLPAPLALLLGFVALRDLKKHPQLLGRGRAWFAIIWGGLMTLFLVFVVVNILIST